MTSVGTLAGEHEVPAHVAGAVGALVRGGQRCFKRFVGWIVRRAVASGVERCRRRGPRPAALQRPNLNVRTVIDDLERTEDIDFHHTALPFADVTSFSRNRALDHSNHVHAPHFERSQLVRPHGLVQETSAATGHHGSFGGRDRQWRQHRRVACGKTCKGARIRRKSDFGIDADARRFGTVENAPVCRWHDWPSRSSNVCMWPQGILPTSRRQLSRSRQAPASRLMYPRLPRDNPVIPGNSLRRSLERRSITLAPQPSSLWRWRINCPRSQYRPIISPFAASTARVRAAWIARFAAASVAA